MKGNEKQRGGEHQRQRFVRELGVEVEEAGIARIDRHADAGGTGGSCGPLEE